MRIAKRHFEAARIVGKFPSILHDVEFCSTNYPAVSISPLRKLIISSLEKKESLINENNSRRKKNIQLCPKLTTGN